MKFIKTLAPLAVGALLTAATSFATPVTGNAFVTGQVTVTPGTITFGNVAPNGPSSGDFSGLVGGTLMNLSGGPATGPQSVTDFGIFNVGTGFVHFDLSNIDAGFGTNAGCAAGAALGAECTPLGSPFTIIQGVNSVSVDLTLEGQAYFQPKNSGSTSTTFGAFTTQLTSLNYSTNNALVQALINGQSISSSYSAEFTATPSSTTPEPASLLLAGIGLLGAGLVARRKARS